MAREKNRGGRVAGLVVDGRERLGLSQSQLYERSKVSRSRIIAVESGASVPTLELCLRLADALGIQPGTMFRAHTRDYMERTDPARMATLETELESSSWEGVSRHQGLQVGRGSVDGTVDDEGDLWVMRRFAECRAVRARRRIVFRDRIVGERPPLFAVKGSPLGLGYSVNVSIQGEWAEHVVEFPRPWCFDDGPFEFELETRLPRAYVLDREEYERRRKAEGLAPQRDWVGEYLYLVCNAFEVLEMGLTLPDGYEPEWREPSATFGSGPVEDAEYRELDSTTSKESQFTASANQARLVVHRPVPGFTFGIRWEPLAWTAKGGKP